MDRALIEIQYKVKDGPLETLTITMPAGWVVCVGREWAVRRVREIVGVWVEPVSIEHVRQADMPGEGVAGV